MQRQRMSNERLAHECQARSVTLSNLTLADDPHGDPASAELLQGACYALTEQATRIAELEGALRTILERSNGYIYNTDQDTGNTFDTDARHVLGEGGAS